MAKGMGNILIFIVIGVVAYFAWKKGYFNKILGGLGGSGSGGIGQPGQAGGVGVSGADGSSANGNDAFTMVQNMLRNNKSGTTACSNGNCIHADGDNVSVHCSNGVCHSNAAYQMRFSM